MAMNAKLVGWFPVLLLMIPCAPRAQSNSPQDDAESTLRATETAFAATMAQRDLRSFENFIAKDAVFFSGDDALRGRSAIVSAWSRFFEAEDAPFSWEPTVVAVLHSGRLGLTSGPVLDPTGEQVGTFNSVWRLEADGSWKIVFDRGCD